MQAPASLPTTMIYPRADGRPLVQEHVAVLADSMTVIGLQTPITVRPCVRVRDGRDVDAYEIVTGRHRHEAAISLDWQEIDAFIMAGDADDTELWEIDENLARAELTPAQRADHHIRREEILKRKGLVSTHGGGRDQNDKLSSCSYAAKAAAALGVDKRTVQRDLARGRKIKRKILLAADDLNGAELDQLAQVPADEQPAKLAEIRKQRSTTEPAPDPLNAPEAQEKQIKALMCAWNRAGADARAEFLLRIDQPVFDHTRAGRAA